MTPDSDEEAVARILDAVDEVVAEHGAGIRLADVARRLGVTRQTVYRYFPNADALLIASAMRAVDGFIDQVVGHVSGVNDPITAVVDCVAFAVERLSGDPQLENLLSRRQEGEIVTSLTSPQRPHSACRCSAASMSIGSFTDSTAPRWKNSPK